MQGRLFDEPAPFNHHSKPALARASDPATSHQAAAKIEPRRESLCGIALRMVRGQPGATAEELWEQVIPFGEPRTFTTLDNLRRRISDLKARGLVRYYGEHDGQSRIWPIESTPDA